jgi:hypothetical protein
MMSVKHHLIRLSAAQIGLLLPAKQEKEEMIADQRASAAVTGNNSYYRRSVTVYRPYCVSMSDAPEPLLPSPKSAMAHRRCAAARGVNVMGC